MKSLSAHHPGAACLYFLCVQLPIVFGINPFTAAAGLASGLMLLGLLEGKLRLRTAAFHLFLPLISALVNPIFNHNGVTVLFFFNSNPVTREAVVCGAVTGLVISAALAWARCFSVVMDTDRLLCVTGALSPKVSLILSMALRYIPLLRRRGAMTREAHLAAGLTREDNAPDRIRGALRVFSGLTTWALENGIVTADSMAARGYGTGRRTRYRFFPWEKGDTLLVFCALGLAGMELYACIRGNIGYRWYPVMTAPDPGWRGIAGYAAFLLLCLSGPAAEAAERIRRRKKGRGRT